MVRPVLGGLGVDPHRFISPEVNQFPDAQPLFRKDALRHVRDSAKPIVAARGVLKNSFGRYNIIDESGQFILIEAWISVDNPLLIIEWWEDDLHDVFTVQELIDFGFNNQSNGEWYITRNQPNPPAPRFVIKYSPSIPEEIQHRFKIDVLNPDLLAAHNIERYRVKFYDMSAEPERRGKGARR